MMGREIIRSETSRDCTIQTCIIAGHRMPSDEGRDRSLKSETRAVELIGKSRNASYLFEDAIKLVSASRR